VKAQPGGVAKPVFGFGESNLNFDVLFISCGRPSSRLSKSCDSAGKRQAIFSFMFRRLWHLHPVRDVAQFFCRHKCGLPSVEVFHPISGMAGVPVPQQNVFPILRHPVAAFYPFTHNLTSIWSTVAWLFDSGLSRQSILSHTPPESNPSHGLSQPWQVQSAASSSISFWWSLPRPAARHRRMYNLWLFRNRLLCSAAYWR
jgi:hypothetical protein